MEVAEIRVSAAMVHFQEPARQMKCFADTETGTWDQILNADQSQLIMFAMKPDLKMNCKTLLENKKMTGAKKIGNNATESVSRDI